MSCTVLFVLLYRREEDGTTPTSQHATKTFTRYTPVHLLSIRYSSRVGAGVWRVHPATLRHLGFTHHLHRAPLCHTITSLYYYYIQYVTRRRGREAQRSTVTYGISRSHGRVAGGARERLGLGNPRRHVLGLAVAAAVQREGRARPRVRGLRLELGLGVGLGV